MARKLSYKYEIEKQEKSLTSKVCYKFDSPVRYRNSESEPKNPIFNFDSVIQGTILKLINVFRKKCR